VFQQLLGLDENTFDANDQTIEGAINLMYKCGYAYEQNVMNASDKTHDEKLDNFKRIFERFDQFVDIEDPRISQRVRLLIKNLFAEKDNKWEQSRNQHEKGLKTKGQVQKEVEEKAMKEQARYDNRGGDRRDRQYPGGGRGDGNYNDGRKGGGGGRDNAHGRKRSEYNGFGGDKPKQ